MKVEFLIEMQVEEVINITPEQFLELENMNNEEKENFFWDQAVRYESKTTKIKYKKVGVDNSKSTKE